jgi:histidyl-tRNA synthetase
MIETTSTTEYTGFNYRFEAEIDKRLKLQLIFNRLCKEYDSAPIEVPLAAPVSSFLGSRPKPLNEKDVQKLLIGHLPDGVPMAVRYEGSALVALKIAKDIADDNFSGNVRHHYFQEMVRLEYSDELDENHLRSFYQSGLEMFALTEEEHQRNKIDLVEFTAKFLSELDTNFCVRISHVDITQAPLNAINLPPYDKRRITGFLEHYQANELFNFLTNTNFDKTIGSILLDLSHLNVCSIDEALFVLKKYPQYFSRVIKEFETLTSSLDFNVLKKCRFDGGIRRSLDFYSGLTFQFDLGGASERGGGGEFTGLVESFGANKTVYSIGMAAGVERLMKVL